MQVMKMPSRVERKTSIILRVQKNPKDNWDRKKRKDKTAKSDENTKEKKGGKKGKSDEKNTNNESVDASQLWLSGRKTVKERDESDEDDE